VKVATTILTSALTSALITVVLGTVFKYYFDRRLLEISHGNQLELTRVSEGLKVIHNAAIERDRQRRESLPKLAERVYRVRNAARKLSNAIEGQPNQPLASLDAEIGKLEVDLYEHRVLLAMDELFPEVHAFKNDARTLAALTSDLIFLRQSNEQDSHGIQDRLASVYQKVDREHSAIVDRIAHILKNNE
jgi:hypothetical protein